MSDMAVKYAKLALAMLGNGPTEARAMMEGRQSYAPLPSAEENKVDMDIAFEPYPEETPKAHYDEAAPRTFKEAFAAARKARLKGGSDTFTWKGKSILAYTAEDLQKKQYQKPEKREVFPLAGYSGRTMSDSQPVQSPGTRRYQLAGYTPGNYQQKTARPPRELGADNVRIPTKDAELLALAEKYAIIPKKVDINAYPEFTTEPILPFKTGSLLFR